MPRFRFDARRVVLLIGLSSLLALAAAAAEPAKKPAGGSGKSAAKTDPNQDARMAEMMKAGAPGPAHEKLKAMEGRWKAVQKAWFGPGEPTVSEGTCENRMILGGRFLEQRMTATFAGQPFEGLGLTGYDNQKGVYTSFWVDNTATYMMTGEGSMDASGQELTVTTKGVGPDGKPAEFKMVTRILDPSRHVFSMYSTADGKDQLVMEITYTRM